MKGASKLSSNSEIKLIEVMIYHCSSVHIIEEHECPFEKNCVQTNDVKLKFQVVIGNDSKNFTAEVNRGYSIQLNHY